MKKFIEAITNIFRYIVNLLLVIFLLFLIGYFSGAILYFVFPLFRIPMIDPFWFILIGLAVFGIILKLPNKGAILVRIQKRVNKRIGK